MTAQKAEEMMAEGISKEKKEVFMTVAEQLRKEGFEKGEEKGIRKGFLESIEQGLTIRFGPEGLKSMPRIKKIQKTEYLRALQAALYTVGDLSEFHRAIESKTLISSGKASLRDQ